MGDARKGSVPVEASVAVRRARSLCTMSGAPGSADPLGEIADGSVAIDGETIVWVGPDRDFAANVRLRPGATELDASGQLVTPGLVDCHTHVVFAGDRAEEFALRNAGATYLEIAAKGGGIQNTVDATRRATVAELVELAAPRVARLLAFGVTTVEAKSGYGLDTASELKMLEAISALGRAQPVELVPTLLCAHAVPREFAHARDAYVRLCLEETIPEAARRGLARFCDAFVEKGAFTVDEGRALLSRARDLGLTPRLHADQLSAMGATELAGELGASSADHLECVTPDGIAALARTSVAAVLVPVSTMFLRQPGYAPGRRLWDAGVPVALATNVNPGSAMSENAALTLSLASLFNGLSPAEALWAFTRGAATALRLDGSVGRLAPGMQADVVLFGADSAGHLPYHLAVNHTRAVLKRGRLVLDRRAETPAACR